MTKSLLLCLLCFTILFGNAKAQIKSSDALFIELKKQDSLLFELSFNQCKLEFLEQITSDELRFYHDQSGKVDKAAFFASIQQNICSNPNLKPIRKLEEGSLEVYPLYENGQLYGAIQSGIHHFYIRELGKEDRWTSTAKFTTVWMQEDGRWQMHDVLSFDHQDPVPGQKKENELERLLRESKVPALGLGKIENGQLTKVQVFGTLDQEKIAPHNSLFKVASLTKPIFALTVLKLIDAGLLGLDEPLHPHWIDPDIKADRRHKKLTPRLVLSHQTGFPNWRYLDESNKLSFEFDPGTKYQYSGEGFEYLRKAIEQKLGQPIEALAKQYIFQPANMKNTHFWWEDTVDESLYAKNYDVNGQLILTNKYYEANAAANLLTTIGDYGNFLSYVLNGAGLSPSLYQEMLKHQVQLKEDNYFGLGWEIMTNFRDGEYVLAHSGSDPGVKTLAMIFPKSKNGFLVFLNGDNAMDIYEYLFTKQLYLGNELWDRR
ncbi:MAG: serine hydrolase [Bacteroidota bacterium]